jgi:hypothetical protein
MGKIIAPDSWPDIALSALKRARPKRIAVGYISSPGPDSGKVMQITLCQNDAEKEYDRQSDKIEIRLSPAAAPIRPSEIQADAYREKLLSALGEPLAGRVLVCAKVLCRISKEGYVIRLFTQFFRVVKTHFFRMVTTRHRASYDWFLVYDRDEPEHEEILEKMSRAEALAAMLKGT